MENWDELLSRWTIAAGLGFGGLPDPATLRPQMPVADVLRANDELTRQHSDYWAGLDARYDVMYK